MINEHRISLHLFKSLFHQNFLVLLFLAGTCPHVWVDFYLSASLLKKEKQNTVF